VSAGRVGARSGQDLRAHHGRPARAGRAKRLRAFLELLDGNLDGARKVGSVHDMRFVFIDDDTRMIFATTFDGDWDPYIDDFITNIPDYLDIMNSAWEGWPGIHSPDAKDYLVKHQVSAEGWYVGHPDLTVAETTGSFASAGRGRVSSTESATRRSPGREESAMTLIDRLGGNLRPRRSPSSSTTSRPRCCATGLSRTTARTSCST
jgi:hypothetical protein